jgi:hypothetical protein
VPFGVFRGTERESCEPFTDAVSALFEGWMSE